jgi:hypothetical protein
MIARQIKGIKTKEEQEAELKITEEAIDSAKKISKEPKNNFKGFKLIANSDTKLLVKSRNAGGNKTISTSEFVGTKTATQAIKTRNLLRPTSSLVRPVSTAGSIKRKMSNTNKAFFFLTTSKTISQDSPVNTERKNFVSIDFKAPTMHTTIYESDKNAYRQTTTLNEQMTIGASIVKPETKFSLKLKLGREKFNWFKCYVTKIIKDMTEKNLLDNKVILSRSIKNTLKDWKKTVGDKKFVYSSGEIALPLVSQLQNN